MPKPLIDIRHLSKSYVNEELVTDVLFDINLIIKKGEYVAIMGPSGSGKSTLLHILGLLDRQTKGKYYFDGKSVDRYDDVQLAHVRNRSLGFVFQSFFLLRKTSVFNNVILPLYYSSIPRREWKKLATQAIDSVGLSHRMTHEPSQLSGGERQRVAIARALVLEPDIIFADEPTGNLDTKTGAQIMSLFDELNIKKKHTVVLITHDPSIAAHARRIIKIRDGHIVEDKKQ